MKPLSLFLIFSLAANAALAALIIFSPAHTHQPGVNPSKPTEIANNESAHTRSGKLATPWSQIQAADDAQFIKNLKAAGVPDEAIHEIVVNRIGEKYRAKYRALRGMDNNPPYWKMRTYGMNDISPETVSELTRLGNEQRELEKSLFPDKSTLADEDAKALLRRKYGDISDEKIAALETMQEEHRKRLDQSSDTLLAAKTLEERQAALKQQDLIFAEQKDAFEKLLSPDELLEYNLRNDYAAHRIRFDTPQFDLTESEFRALYPIYKIQTDQLTPIAMQMRDGPPTREKIAAYDAARIEIEAQRNAQVREILGAERYADYLQAIDPSQKKLNLIVQRLELPLSAARTVTAVQTNIAERAAEIDANTDLTPPQRSEQYKALATEAQKNITQTLGVRGYAVYRENSQNWIQYLESGKAPQK